VRCGLSRYAGCTGTNGRRCYVGIEILDASSRLHPDLLDEAEILS
jgi:hypothetical protein